MSTLSVAAREIAGNASLQAFANCYLREVDAGTWHNAASWQASSRVRLSGGETHVVKLELESQQQVLAIGVRFRSRVGRHTLTDIYRRKVFQKEWLRIDPLSTQLLLIDALYAQRPESEQRLELIGRVVESHQMMAEYVQRQLRESARFEPARSGRISGFIESEQSLVLGHWLHPTPKSRQGMIGWQHEHYAPELAGRFQLHFFAAQREIVRQESLLDTSAEEISRRIAIAAASADEDRRLAAMLGDEYCLVPLHPLQAQWLLHQDYVLALIGEKRLVDLGRIGPLFTPTSSVRTLYCDALDLMIKLSIPVKITNSLRINLQSELGDSVWISQLLRASGISEEFPELQAIEDPAYITLALPDREETGFEVIFRSNPFHRGGAEQSQRTVHSIAALVQDPLSANGSSLLAEQVRCLAASQRLELAQAGHRWFDAYWKCAIEAPIRIYDQHGIALEAHQQNSLLELEPAGSPICCYYRDIQGLALSECFRAQLVARVPELSQQHKVFEPDDVVRNGFIYYLFFNQLYAVINRFALDGLLDESVLLDVVRRKLLELRGSLEPLGVALIDTLLDKQSIPCKANLLTRLADLDELQCDNELAVYTLVDNPLHSVRHDSSSVRASTSPMPLETAASSRARS
jgi:siderophore synthetase component